MALTDSFSNPSLQSVVIALFFATAARLVTRRSSAAVARFCSFLLESFAIALVLVFLLIRPFFVQSYRIHQSDASMRPTLREGDRILVNKLRYRWSPPERGDTVVFRVIRGTEPTNPEMVKRLVALPGDTVEIRPGEIQIGSKTFRNPEIRAILRGSEGIPGVEGADSAPLRLASDAVWVGDHLLSPGEFAAMAGYLESVPVRIRPGLVLRNDSTLVEDYVAEDPEYLVPRRRIPSGFGFVLGDNRNHSDDSHRGEVLPLDRIVGRAELVFWPPHRIRILP